MKKRQIVIGDVHGEVEALEHLIAALDLKTGDALIFLGDVVDKGLKSRACIDFLIDLQHRYECTFIRGNHEAIMLGAISGDYPDVENIWLNHGGEKTIASYSAESLDDLRRKLPPAHLDFLKSTIDAYMTKTHLFIHAGWDSKKPFHEQTSTDLRYTFMNAARPDKRFGRQIICGHSALRGGKPAAKGNILCIDTIEYGWLTAYDIGSKRFLQANSAGETRHLKKAEKFSQKKHVPRKFWL